MIVVTGGCGFIGVNLILKLNQIGMNSAIIIPLNLFMHLLLLFMV